MIFNKKWGFTLAEIVVSVSVSLILMLWVGTFITSWLKNITSQKKILDSTSQISWLYEDIQWVFSGDVKLFTWALNWDILVKNSYIYWMWNFNILAKRDFDSECVDMYSNSWVFLTWSYLVNYNFTPFEWIWGDIFSSDWYLYSSWSLKVKFYDNSLEYNSQILSWFFENISWVYENNTDIFISDSKKHWVYQIPKSWFSASLIPVKIVWSNIYGYDSDLPKTWNQTYLNNPSGLAIVWDNLFISDSGNNRIVYYNLTSKELNLFLDKNDWIYTPTWLFYDSVDKKFYISNSWRGGVYEISINWTFPSSLNLKYDTKWNTYSWVDKLILEPIWNWNVTWSYSSWSFNFDNWLNIPVLTWSLNSWKFELEFWTTDLNTQNWTVDIIPFSYSWSWNVYFKIDFLSWWSSAWTIYAWWFVVWDGDLLTKDDNILKIYDTYNYPTWIFKESWKICVNDFWLRKKRCFGWSVENLTDYDFSRFNFSKSYLRLKDYKTFVNTDVWVKSLNMKINYYKSYDCNDSNQNVESTMIYKKKFQ